MALRKTSVLVCTCAVVALLGWETARRGWAGAASGDRGSDAKHFDDQCRGFLAKHCKECHGAEKPKGKFRVDQLLADFSDKANRERWQSVQAQLKAGAMPPKGKARPQDTELRAVHDWINGRVTATE